MASVLITYYVLKSSSLKLTFINASSQRHLNNNDKFALINSNVLRFALLFAATVERKGHILNYVNKHYLLKPRFPPPPYLLWRTCPLLNLIIVNNMVIKTSGI